MTETQEADTCELQQLQAEVGRLRKELEKARRGPHRKRLPHTRRSVTHKFGISGHEGYVIVGLFDDGQPGEVFIKMAKQGSTMSGLVDTIAILISHRTNTPVGVCVMKAGLGCIPRISGPTARSVQS
jgi:hypothetical protein